MHLKAIGPDTQPLFDSHFSPGLRYITLTQVLVRCVHFRAKEDYVAQREAVHSNAGNKK